MASPFALIILDGFAHNPNPQANAVSLARKPNLDRLFATYPYTELVTFGERVGLPDDQMGNSEVGHLNIGAGRVVEQDLLRINRAVREKTLTTLPALQQAAKLASAPGKAVHFFGLSSTGGVHSSLEHLTGLVEAVLELGCPRVYLHLITDGRDRPPSASLLEISSLESELKEIGSRFPQAQVAIVDVIGRYYAMDRDKRWERTKLAYDLYTLGRGEKSTSALDAIKLRINSGETDEFYKPVLVDLPNSDRSGCIEDGDVAICFNFRADRMRQLVAAFSGDKVGFSEFTREKKVTLATLLTLTNYEKGLPVEVMFPPISLHNNLGQVISQSGLTQLRLAETEKYPHVTYFFNSGVEEPYPGEERALVPSPREVATYDQKPEMSAYGVTEIFLDRMSSKDLLVVNYANCDMVGHTGVIEAAVKAVETVDKYVGQVVEKLLSLGGAALITADHGNADQMVDYETGEPHTFHTKHPVPCCLVSEKGYALRNGGALCDIAPTILEFLGIPCPKEMTGRSLLR